MAQLAIRGHATRWEEVIEILKMLGGENYSGYIGSTEMICYYIDRNGHIECDKDEEIPFPVHIFTIEDFLKKFSYKIGDRVSSKYLKNYKIEKMEWEVTNGRVIYKLQGMGWYSAEELQPYKEETMDKANKVVFDTNAQCCDIMNHIIKEKAMEEIKIDIPKGYEFAGVDDDNQQVVFTKIGYHYPNTYEECCDVLSLVEDGKLYTKGYKASLIQDFQKLIICRDAYWKIASDWKPDWTKADERKYCIANTEGNITKWVQKTTNKNLAFPTEEIRDAFYENFKELIEECKELL